MAKPKVAPWGIIDWTRADKDIVRATGAHPATVAANRKKYGTGALPADDVIEVDVTTDLIEALVDFATVRGAEKVVGAVRYLAGGDEDFKAARRAAHRLLVAATRDVDVLEVPDA